MTKFWTIVLFVVLMGIQTFSVMSHVLPSHPENLQAGDLPLTQLSDVQVDHWQDGEQGSFDLGDDHPAPEQCHTCHCHGSHFLLAMQPFAIPLSPARQLVPGYDLQHSSGFLAAILRPPIA